MGDKTTREGVDALEIRPRDGEAGRSPRSGLRRRLPLAKNWKAEYNLQAQDSPLSEKYPSGLRNKRLQCVVFLTVAGAIIVTINLLMMFWLYSHVNLNADGLDGFIIHGDHVQFEQTFEAENVTIPGRSVSSNTPSVQTRDGVPLSMQSDTLLSVVRPTKPRGKDSEVDLSPDAVTSKSKLVDVTEITSSGEGITFFSAAPSVVAFSSSRVTVDGDMNARKVSVADISSSVDKNLIVRSSNGIVATGLGDTKLASQSLDVLLTSISGDISLTASSDAGYIMPATISLDSSQYAIDMSRMPKPNNAPVSSSYTLCMCPKNKTFLMPGDSDCSTFAPAWTSDPCN